MATAVLGRKPRFARIRGAAEEPIFVLPGCGEKSGRAGIPNCVVAEGGILNSLELGDQDTDCAEDQSDIGNSNEPCGKEPKEKTSSTSRRPQPAR